MSRSRTDDETRGLAADRHEARATVESDKVSERKRWRPVEATKVRAVNEQAFRVADSLPCTGIQVSAATWSTIVSMSSCGISMVGKDVAKRHSLYIRYGTAKFGHLSQSLY
jgi:hypothetical protein